jgi:cytoskeleton protein RodZ
MVADMVPPVPEQYSSLANPPAEAPPVPDEQAPAPVVPDSSAVAPAGEAAADANASAPPGDATAKQDAAVESEAPPAPSPIPAVPSVATPADAHAATPAAGEADARVYGEGNVGSRITVRADADSWIQVRAADETLLITRILRKGESYLVPNQPGLKLMTGSAGALEILVDGQLVPSLGPVGAVKRNVPLDAERLKAGTAAN